MSHWTERLFREQADLFAETFADRFDAADEEAGDLLELLADEYDCEPHRTLDVACGVGRHVLALAERGCHAEGLDFSAEYVERAREHARDRGVADRTRFHHEDMRDLDEWDAGEYDLVTILWNSLGYYDRATDERVIAAVRELLDDGVLVVELGNKDFHLANGTGASVSEPDEGSEGKDGDGDGGGGGDGDGGGGGDGDGGGESGCLQVTRRRYDVTTGRFHTTADWFDATDEGYDHVDTLEWEQRMYAPVVLRDLCLDAGFESVDLYADFDGTELTRDDPTVVAVAE